ncbi:MAG TPA: DUF4405 domain-containing protein [Deltaproteobacteria bacterium]|nr:DUF4405 domain-containing protein [Deltaproteobacteria bacterium]
MKKNKKIFHLRGCTTFILIISFIVDSLSGIILYIAPQNRFADWTMWTLWGLTKDQWVEVHTIFGFVFLLVAAIHLYYNWKIFVHYVWSSARKAVNLKRELTAASVLCLVLFLGSVWNVPPFNTVMDIGKYFRDKWEQESSTTPSSSTQSEAFKDLAGNAASDQAENGHGSGMGRKTLEEVVEEQGLSWEDVISRLESQGIEAKPDDRLRSVAARLGKSPTETLRILAGEQ